MTEKVLFVDDERNVLDGIQRHLRRKFSLETALGPQEGLETVKNRGPFAVVISDLRMPVMDGIQFLSRVKELAPDTVRMVLTGNADLENTIQAVNEGQIFRFLTKPCSIDLLAKAISLGIDQYRLVTAARELLQKTLKGSIKVINEVISLVNPEAFGRSSRVKRYVTQIAGNLGVPDAWQLELAAMLSQIGCVILPQEALNKLYKGESLSAEETQLFDMHPMIASDLLSNIPRLQKVAEIVRYQEKHFDGSGIPRDARQGKAIPLGARILKVVLDFDVLEAKGFHKGRALSELKKRLGRYDPDILAEMEALLGDEARYMARDLMVHEFKPGMILDRDVRTEKGKLLISRGQEISPMLLNRLKGFTRTEGIKEPIRVLIPLELVEENLADQNRAVA
ncbi:MAG: hypothetical protein DRN37_10525 [Thermoplasmata archaeon]|nr:MAG: hypothetical protein DRN37_10525 [Thermoplasmata archaeon]